MLTLDEAQARLLAGARLTDAETVPLTDAVGRVLADSRVSAAVDVPPFANSAMDGYALRAADAPGELRVVGEIAAGAPILPEVAVGTAVRIMTGAPMPPGADTVVPVEDVEEAEATVRVPASPVGANVRAAAHDTRAGDEIELSGPLTAPKVAVLASVGLGEVLVRRRPRVAILSTGDELVGVGEALGPHQIHDSNGVALAAAVIEAGGEPIVLPRARDDAGIIERTLLDGASRADLLVTSAGVSVGRHDHVRSVLAERGSLDFWRIAIQPGKPLAVGELGGATVVGLPGNPVSALVVFELTVRRLIRAMLGLARRRSLARDGRRRGAHRQGSEAARLPPRPCDVPGRPAGGRARPAGSSRPSCGRWPTPTRCSWCLRAPTPPSPAYPTRRSCSSPLSLLDR